MAISRKRLDELINEGATIWSDVWDEEVYLNNKCYLEPYHNNSIPTEPVNDYVLWVYEDDEHINKYFISQLEENVKGAKWALKYHATRTEELNLPMFDEKQDITYWFFDAKGFEILLVCVNGEVGVLRYDNKALDKELFCEPATEENYIKACDLCLKLFKGEEE